jgi:hypothetical protein
MSAPVPKPKVWQDPVEEKAARRLWAAVVLAPRVEVCEALFAGVLVPAHRLDPTWRVALRLNGRVVLDEALVLQVNGHGPR